MTLSEDVEIKLDWPGGGSLVEKMRLLRTDARTGYRPRELRFSDFDGRERRVEVHPESWFWILLGSCSQIAVSYPWRETEIPWFVLTGLPPAVEPIFAGTEVLYSEDKAEPALAAITLRIFPFVSEGSVLRAYRLERLFLLGTRPVRPVPLPNLWLFDFVEERLHGSERPPGWAALLKEWNRDMPKWRKSDRSQFRRDYMRTKELLVNPRYRETL